MSPPVVSLRGVSVRYGQTTALDAVDLDPHDVAAIEVADVDPDGARNSIAECDVDHRLRL